ncbi:hypothetical protein NFJ02_11g05810 [Pycnococcus provasolii]
MAATRTQKPLLVLALLVSAGLAVQAKPPQSRLSQMFREARAHQAALRDPTLMQGGATAPFATIATQTAKAYLTYEPLSGSYASQWRAVTAALLLARRLNATLVMPTVFPYPNEVGPGNGLPTSLFHVPGDFGSPENTEQAVVLGLMAPAAPPDAPFVQPPNTVTQGLDKDGNVVDLDKPYVQGEEVAPKHAGGSRLGRRRRRLLAFPDGPANDLETHEQRTQRKKDEKTEKKEKKKEKERAKKEKKDVEKKAEAAKRAQVQPTGHKKPPKDLHFEPFAEWRAPARDQVKPAYLPPWRDAGERIFKTPPLAMPFGYIFDASKFVDIAKEKLGIEVVANLPREVGYPGKDEATATVSFDDCRSDPAVVQDRRRRGVVGDDSFCLGPNKHAHTKLMQGFQSAEQLVNKIHIDRSLSAAKDAATAGERVVKYIHYAFPPLVVAIPVHKYEICTSMPGCMDAVAAVQPNRVITHAAERAIQHLGTNFSSFDVLHWSQEIPDAGAIAEHGAKWREEERGCETPLEQRSTYERADKAISSVMESQSFKDKYQFDDFKAGLFIATTVNDPQALKKFKANFAHSFVLDDLVPSSSMRFPPVAIEALSFEIAAAAPGTAYTAGQKKRDGRKSGFSSFSSLLCLIRTRAGLACTNVPDEGHC